jgi:hypothetical protein
MALQLRVDPDQAVEHVLRRGIIIAEVGKLRIQRRLFRGPADGEVSGPPACRCQQQRNHRHNGSNFCSFHERSLHRLQLRALCRFLRTGCVGTEASNVRPPLRGIRSTTNR